MFIAGDGRLLQPTARLVWDRLIEQAFVVQGEPQAVDESTLDATRMTAEERGGDAMAAMIEARRAKVTRECKSGERAFAARRRAIERLGLPQVKQKRLAELERELDRSMIRLRDMDRDVPGLDPILFLRVAREGA
jgi:hypothetical protein